MSTEMPFRLSTAAVHKGLVLYNVCYGCSFLTGDTRCVSHEQVSDMWEAVHMNSQLSQAQIRSHEKSWANGQLTYGPFCPNKDDIRIWERTTQVGPLFFFFQRPILCHNLIQTIMNNNHNILLSMNTHLYGLVWLKIHVILRICVWISTKCREHPIINEN